MFSSFFRKNAWKYAPGLLFVVVALAQLFPMLEIILTLTIVQNVAVMIMK